MANMTRISVLQLALEGQIGRGWAAAGRGDLPAAGGLAQEQRAALDERHGGGRHLDARVADLPSGRQLEREDRLFAGALLLVLERLHGVLAQLGAGGSAV